MPEPLRIAELTSNPTINLALDTLRIGKQAIVFVNSKRSAEKTAEDIAKKIRTERIQNERKLHELSEDVRTALSRPTKQCERLAQIIRKGVAYHHAGLVQKQKELIEDAFRDGIIKIISATTTLAAGVDLPSFRTILKDLKRYSGPRGLTWIPVLEYQQMAGRSGRPRYDTFGQAIVLADTESTKDALVEKYIFGEPEPIYSKLAVEPVLRMYLLSLIASEFVRTRGDILAFFEKTFWAHQFGDMAHLESIISRVLDLLEEFEFIRQASHAEDFVSATDMADAAVTATMLGRRVSELYIDPLSAHEMIVCIRRAQETKTDCFSFVHMAASRLEMRPPLKAKTKEWEEIQEKLAEKEWCILDPEPTLYDPEYEDFLHATKTALFFEEWMEEKDEQYLLEKFDIRPGEVRVKLQIAEWLLYSASELARLMRFQPVISHINRTRFRLRYGVKEELLTLLKLQGIGRVRARRLYDNRIRDIADVKKADVATLAQILGRAVATDLKRQIGEDVGKTVVPERKRKGQISLHDFA